MTEPCPSLFISHGSPMMALEASPARLFLQQLAAQLPRPRAILVCSAHWETRGGMAIGLAAQPATLHDFGGFPAPLYALRYPAPGAPELGAALLAHLQSQGHKVSADPNRGLDHGAWVPLQLMYPQADIPVLQISLHHGASPSQHWHLGQHLRQFQQQGLLILASGSWTHNLRALQAERLGGDTPTWVSLFSDWMRDKLEQGDLAALLDYRAQAPYARENHPSEEHLLPLFVALGAAEPQARPHLLHHSVEHGVLCMDSYAFSRSSFTTLP